MIILTSTDALELITSSAADLAVYACFMDAPLPILSSSSVTQGNTSAAITSATTTTIVSAPSASTARNVKTLNIRNSHATLSNDLTVQVDVSGTNRELFKITLRAGETLEYVEGVGFFVAGSVTKTAKRLAGPSTPAKSEAGTTLYDPAAGVRTKIENAVITNTHASLAGWVTLSVGSIATKANRIISGLYVPPGTTLTVPLDLILDGDTSDDLRARHTVDMTYSAMTMASATALIADTNAGSATGIATASWAAKNGAVYYMAVGWTGTPTISSFTDTHSGITWTLVQSVSSSLVDTPTLAIYRAQSTGTTNTTTTVTFSAAPTGAFISIVEIVGGDTSGTHGSACIMAAGTRYLSPTNTNLFLPGTEFCGARIATFMHDGAAGTWSPGSGFTEVHDGTYATPSTALTTIYAISQGKDASAVAGTTSAENLIAMVDVQDSTMVITVTLNGTEEAK